MSHMGDPQAADRSVPLKFRKPCYRHGFFVGAA